MLTLKLNKSHCLYQTGNIAPIPRVGFPGLCLQDGPLSIRQSTYASVFPAGLSAAASWDRDLIRMRGEYLGAEFRAKGAHILLGPVAGPLGRSADAGRGWEGTISIDVRPAKSPANHVKAFLPIHTLPVLLWRRPLRLFKEVVFKLVLSVRPYIRFSKQYQYLRLADWIGNEQETQRNPTKSPNNVTIEAVSANIDDRTMHELYM